MISTWAKRKALGTSAPEDTYGIAIPRPEHYEALETIADNIIAEYQATLPNRPFYGDTMTEWKFQERLRREVHVQRWHT